jgi:hypothetical protein
MLEIVIVAYKLGQKVEPSRRSQSKNGQATYEIPMSIQVGRRIDQIYEDPRQVMVPISKPQTVYITLIVITQINKYVGWPPLIPLKCE